VISQRQRSSNRANSAKSTGPRTQAGKAAGRLNARLHGLASAVRGEPGVDAEIERLASAIANEAGRPDLIGSARQIAEAELDVRRIRRARATFETIPAASLTSYRLVGDRLDKLGWRGTAHEAPLKPGSRSNFKLDTLERYERRATSRRKSAIRRLTC
jgi:hypothetical protein